MRSFFTVIIILIYIGGAHTQTLAWVTPPTPSNLTNLTIGQEVTISITGGVDSTYNIVFRSSGQNDHCFVSLGSITTNGISPNTLTITIPSNWEGVNGGSGTDPCVSGGSTATTNPGDRRFRATNSQSNTFITRNLGIISGPAPIELSSFEVIKAENITNVTWSTATETNNDYFTIERSADGSNFTSIGMVDGAGNSSTSLDYSYTDVAPLTGTSYYRLKQTDYDGQFTYSDVRAIQFSAGKKINFAYDAQGEEIRIQSSISDLSVRIVDMAGRVLKTIPTASSLTQVSVSYLQAGTYAVIVAGSSGVSETFKFVR